MSSGLLTPNAVTPNPLSTRKVISIIFADLMGSTALHERLDPESVNRVMDAYYRAVRGPVEAAGGTVVQLLGDGVLCAFGIPRVAEDDALRAVRAAMGIQQAFREFLHGQQWLTIPIGLRVAVNTGEVVVSDEHPAGLGDPLNVAARLQQEARDGEVLIGQATRRLVADTVTLERAGVFALKGRAETVTAYRVVSLERPTGVATAAFVGRDEELARITDVYGAALARPAARLAVVLGSPGLGKSRLINEVARRLGDGASVVSAQCEAAGGATFAPVAEALRRWLARRTDSTHGTDQTDASDPSGVGTALATAIPDEAECKRIAGGITALLAGSPASPEETFFVIRRFLAALAQQQPVILVIDDLHWAEPLLLDLVEHLIQWGTGVPLLVLVGARPELRDVRSSLVTSGGLVSDVVTLSGLDAGAAMRLAANVIGASDLPAVVAAKVLATSEGNPLFVSELARMLVDEGALERQGDRWIVGANLAALEMPPTIHALLAARIERLRPEERTVLERAAVVGRHFSRSAVAALLGRNGSELDARLEALRRTELIERDTGWFLGEPALRFHHVLIRDAAYRRLLKGTRAELHERFADWIEARVGDAAEHDETIGWHLEQAHQLLGELGPLDAGGTALGDRAARRLAAAGRRALARDDLLPAASLLGRALDRLGADDPARADLVLDWCDALLAAGDVGSAAKAIEELGRFAKVAPSQQAGDGLLAVRLLAVRDEDAAAPTEGLTANSLTANSRLSAWHTCFGGQLAVLTDPKALRAAEGAVAAAAETLTAAGDTRGEAKAHSVHALVLAQLGKIGACEAALDRALAAARRVRGERRLANAVLAGAPLAALWGPSPVTRASGRCLDVVRVLRITQGAPAVEAVALRCQAVLETLRGRGEAARRMIAASRKLVEELGITQRVLEADLFAGLIELLEGDADAAERWLRSAWDGLRDEGLGIAAAQAGALFARALLAQGRIDEADAVSRESESLAGDSFQAAIAWRGVRAEVLAARGEHAGAIELARAAVEIAAATDDLLDHADARASLAVALRAAGRASEADAEQHRAVELWEAKGATLLVQRAGRETAQVVAVAAPPELREPPARHARRRLHPNLASTVQARGDAALAAGDFDALEAVFSADYEEIDHPTGTRYGRDGMTGSLRRLFRSPGASYLDEALATLGEFLMLKRRQLHASGTGGGRYDVAEYENEAAVVMEVDASGLVRRQETFAAHRLGDAVARLYERYAELLPEGREHDRAAAVARTIAAYCGPLDADRFAATWAPDVEYVDRRRIGMMGSARGIAAMRQMVESLIAAAPDTTNRVDDVLALRPDAWLRRTTNLGTDRTTGGAYERPQIMLTVTGSDGLVTRIEQFDPDCEAEALARFDELTTPPLTIARRVRPNAAMASADRLHAAVLARDFDAIAALLADELEVIHHPTGGRVDREGGLKRWRMLTRAEGLQLSVETFATLGDALALGHDVTSFDRLEQDDLSFGASCSSYLTMVEIDARGRCTRVEVFADDRLGDAIVRLYERYAELRPEGPERTRAAAVARSVAVLLGPVGADGLRGILADGATYTDRRPLGFPPLRGREEIGRWLATLFDLATDVTFRLEEVIDLRPGCLLARWNNVGAVGGGAFERQFLAINAFDADGRLAIWEHFAPERVDPALARFDELTAPPPRPRAARRLQPNAATAHEARLCAMIAARDADALRTLVTDDVEVVYHPTGSVYRREEALRVWRAIIQAPDGTLAAEPLATLGHSLTLARIRVWAAGTAGTKFDVGPWELEHVEVCEVDGQGRNRRTECFAADLLGDAVVRLYERYAELLPEGPERARAAATARTVTGSLGPWDLDRYAEGLAPDVEYSDRRTLGFGAARGAEAMLRILGSMLEVVNTAIIRVDDVLALAPDAYLVRCTSHGNDRAGGSYERTFLLIDAFGPDGRVTHTDVFDADRATEALARFDELTAPARAARRMRPNAATAFVQARAEVFAARDVEAVGALLADDYEAVYHPTGLVYDRSAALATARIIFAIPSVQFTHEPIATLGDALLLGRELFRATGDAFGLDVGESEVALLSMIEASPDGRARRGETFAADRLGDAVVRLYERYAELLPEGADRTRAARTARSAAAMMLPPEPPDLERLTEAFAPDIELLDNRSLGTWTARGAEAGLQHFRSLLDMVDDIFFSDQEILRLEPDLLLVRRTHCGTARDGGGAYERRFLILLAFAPDGRLARIEWFDPDREADALARFDALTAPQAVVARRVRPNAVAGFLERANAAIRAGDFDALSALHAGGIRAVHHQTGTVVNRAELLAWWRLFFGDRGAAFPAEPIATLGDSLMLYNQTWTGSGSVDQRFDVGPWQQDALALAEVDAEGRAVWIEVFGREHLSAAVARLYERYAERLPDGPERARAAATARSVAVCAGPIDPDRFATVYAPSLRCVDHRILGTWSTHDPAELVRHFRLQLDLAPDFSHRFDDVLAGEPDALLIRETYRGTGRDSGGAFENRICALFVFAADGLVTGIDVFEAEQEARALARFEELVRDTRGERTLPTSRQPFANAATRLNERFKRAWVARDWEAIAALFAPELQLEDRRRLLQMEGEVETNLAYLRVLFDVPRSAWTMTPIATRGERLALSRYLFEGDAAEGGGALAIDYLGIDEVGSDGRSLNVVIFDPDDLDAAFAELDRRYAAGEGAALPRTPIRFLQSVANRDWQAVAALCAPTLVEHDHRHITGVGTTHGPDAWVEKNVRVWVDLAPDIVQRFTHLRGCNRGFLWQISLEGSRQGGPFEIAFAGVTELDAQRRIERIDLYDLDQLDAALGRFGELTAQPAEHRFANAATRAIEEFVRCARARDLEGGVAVYAPGARMIDRRRLIGFDLAGSDVGANIRIIFDMGFRRWQSDLLATRGERLALFRVAAENEDGAVVEFVAVNEVDAGGRVKLSVAFDRDDLDAAYAELDARYAAGEAAPRARVWAIWQRFTSAWAARDWDALATALAPDLRIEDHRKPGLTGGMSRDEYVASARSLVELRPDVRMRVDHVLALDDRRSLNIGRLVGADEDGSFEIALILVAEFGADSIRGWHVYDVDDLDAARARYDALGAAAPPDPLAAVLRPNAASTVMDRVQAAIAARDWPALRALAADGARFEDRRRCARISHDVDGWLADVTRASNAEAFEFQRTLVATAGDRVCLERALFAGGPPDGRIEVEALWLTEVDGSGRLVDCVLFDADDRRAAQRKAVDRWLTTDPAAAVVIEPVLEILQGFNDHDRARIRAVLADDVVMLDQRLSGLETTGADAYVESLAVTWPDVPDIQSDWFPLLQERHGCLGVGGIFGTFDGGPFEVSLVSLLMVTGGCVTRIEIFELEAMDAALARFAELRPDPLRIPPNATTRATTRWHQAVAEGDWESVEDLFAPAIVFEDRRRGFLTSGDREMLLANTRVIATATPRTTRTTLATAGERLALERQVTAGTYEGAAYEVEFVELLEVDTDGRLVTVIVFDPDDRRAASVEMSERFRRGEGQRIPAAARDGMQALLEHDFERLRGVLPDDFVFHDHRRTGLGRLEGAAAFIESLAPLAEQAPDFCIETLYSVALGEHGMLDMARVFGTLAASGGAFEIHYARLGSWRGDRLVALELFEPEDLDRARARFEALRPDPAAR